MICYDFYTLYMVRPHRSTTYVDAAYCYRPSSVVCRLLVCRSVCHTSEPCENGCTDRDAVWVEDSAGPKESCIRWDPDPPWEGAILRGKGASHCKVYGQSAVPCAKTAEPIEMLFGLLARMGRRNHALDWGPLQRC